MQFSLLFTTALAVFSGSATAAPTEEPPSDVCLMICYFQQPNCTEPAVSSSISHSNLIQDQWALTEDGD
jgi:hypothetical protein